MQVLLQERCYDLFRTAITVTIASALLLALEE